MICKKNKNVIINTNVVSVKLGRFIIEDKNIKALLLNKLFDIIIFKKKIIKSRGDWNEIRKKSIKSNYNNFFYNFLDF